MSEKTQRRKDTWLNLANGLNHLEGGSQLQRFHFTGVHQRQQLEVLEALYYADDMARKICNKPAQHMLRELPKINLGESDLADSTQALQSQLDELNAYEKIVEAMTWEAVFGGSAILIGADDGQNPAEPLDLSRVARVDFLTVLTPRDLVAHSWYENPLAKDYGRVRSYRFSSGGQVFHESRFLIFRGGVSTFTRRREQAGWGMSKLDSVYPALKIYNAAWISLAEMIQTASQGVFAMSNLEELTAAQGSDAVVARLTLLDRARSAVNSMLIDKESESFDRVTTSFASLPELTDRLTVRLAAAAEIPVAILVGREPSGLNATGEADVRNWYDQVAAMRKDHLHPRLEYLVKVLLTASEGPTKGKEPENWSIAYPSLWQPTPAEDSAVKLQHAQRDEIYIRNGVLEPEEIALSRFAATGYGVDITTVDLDKRQPGASDEASDPMDETASAPSVDVAVAPGEPAKAQEAYNGAQVASMVQIAQLVAAGELPRESAVAILQKAFPLSSSEAEAIVPAEGSIAIAPAPPFGGV